MYSCSRNVARARVEELAAELKGRLPTDDMLPLNVCSEGAVIRSKGTVANCLLEKGIPPLRNPMLTIDFIQSVTE